MSAFARRVAELTGVPEDRLERLAAESLSEVLMIAWPDGRRSVAKGGPAIAAEAVMLRAIAAAGLPAPRVEGEHQDVLLLEYVENDGLFSANAWADIGTGLRKLHGHVGPAYGWPVDFALGSVTMDNRESPDWPSFWGERRLLATARLLDRPWRERVEKLAARIDQLLPAAPSPALLHGDLWTGNVLVQSGRLAGLIDPACYYGHAEVDLAMLTLFDSPPESFREAYGPLDPGWEQRRAAYQLFPAMVHLRLFGASYQSLVDRMLGAFSA